MEEEEVVEVMKMVVEEKEIMVKSMQEVEQVEEAEEGIEGGDHGGDAAETVAKEEWKLWRRKK